MPPQTDQSPWRHRNPLSALPAKPTALVVLFMISRVIILMYLAGRGTDLGVHKSYAAQIRSGAIPFREFTAEYPPLCFAFTAAPVLWNASLSHFEQLFRVQCLIVDCAVWTLLLLSQRFDWTKSLCYIVGTTFLGPVIYDRVDIVVALLLLVGTLSLRRGHWTAGSLALGLGVAFKLIPIVLIPCLLTLVMLRARRKLGMSLLMLALPTALSFLPVILLGGTKIVSLLQYHHERGIQIESELSTVELLGSWVGLQTHTGFEFGSENLHSSIEPALIAAAQLILGLIACVFGPMLILRHRHNDGRILTVIVFVVAAALCFSKVLSTQYLIFLFPLLLILPTGGWTSMGRLTAIAGCLCCALTGLIFPWFYGDLSSGQLGAQVLLLARNELLLGILLALGVTVFRRELERDLRRPTVNVESGRGWKAFPGQLALPGQEARS